MRPGPGSRFRHRRSRRFEGLEIPVQGRAGGTSPELTLHVPAGARSVGLDNTHEAEIKRRPAFDRKRRRRTFRLHDYRDAASLVADFWSEVGAVMDEKGLWQ